MLLSEKETDIEIPFIHPPAAWNVRWLSMSLMVRSVPCCVHTLDIPFVFSRLFLVVSNIQFFCSSFGMCYPNSLKGYCELGLLPSHVELDFFTLSKLFIPIRQPAVSHR